VLRKIGRGILAPANSYLCHMSIEEKEAIQIFEEAVELSRNESMLFLGSIAFYQKKPKGWYCEWADKSERCKELYELIQTNCEAMTFQAMKYKKLDIKQGLFMLEREFGIKEDQKPITVKIEGMKDEDVQNMIDNL
jgi:hypothetical protein